MSQAIDIFLGKLDARLDKGAREYKNRSFTRSVRDVEKELEEELLDLVGWTYVMWTMAAHKANTPGNEMQLRETFFRSLRHRLMRNDRGTPDVPPANGAWPCMCDLEILAMDLFDLAEKTIRRLHPIARAVEVARWMTPISGRRGGACDPRSSD